MQTIKVDLKENSYEIAVGHRILPELGDKLSSLGLKRDVVIITNPFINRTHGKFLISALKKKGFHAKTFEVPDGERSKSAKTAFKLIEKINAYSVNRQIFIAAFGGGVIGDLAGFIAAIFKRGIPFIQVPTTFLAQIDSAIGGKVAVDLASGKNLVGAFYQPKIVWSDVEFLTTLSKRQIKNGLSEAVKYGIICDKSLFDFIYNNHESLLAADIQSLKEVVYRCSEIKARVVMADERETKGTRTILNFGHTIGHAIEAASKYRYYHGEAVALGMCVAAEISFRMGFLKKQDVATIKKILVNIGLPVVIERVSLPGILEHMQFDKKFRGRKNRFVLATNIGSVKVVEGIDSKIIRAAVKSHLN